MTILRRYLQSAVEHDLAKKMVFVGGLRQVGKIQIGGMIIADPTAHLFATREAVRQSRRHQPMWAHRPAHQGLDGQRRSNDKG